MLSCRQSDSFSMWCYWGYIVQHGKNWWCLTVLLLILIAVVGETCVPSCQCTMVSLRKKQKGRSVDCSMHSAPFTSLSHITFPPDTMQLDLSHNQLVKLKEGAFIQLSALRKLNLSSNEISIIEPGAFEGLLNLRHLDLSNNKIGIINGSLFTGLPKLEKLWLNDNHINTIPDGTFNDLTSLHRIDFGSEYLRCDCHLQWVVKWAKSKEVRLARDTVCALPSPMRGRMLRKLSAEQLHCDYDLQLPVFEIKPSHSQLVFEGDKLPFECRASVIHPQTFIAWVREGGEVEITTNKTAGVFVHTSYSPDMTIVRHSLLVENLAKSHEGVWSCQVTTPQGKVTKNVEVEVLRDVSLSCPPVTKVTPKGKYVFKEMMAGVKAEEPCQAGGPGKVVTYMCSGRGAWTDLDTSACSFTSDLTRRLESMAQVDLNSTDVDYYIHRLQQVVMTRKHRFLSGLSSTDVHYLTSILQEQLLPLAFASERVLEAVLGLSSNLTSLPAPLLTEAQADSRATKRVLDILQNLAAHHQVEASGLDWSQASHNIALVELKHIQLRASRAQCLLRYTDENLVMSHNSKLLSCSRLGNSTEHRHSWNEHADVFIDLPATLLQDAGAFEEHNTSVFITVFRNGQLFPTTTSLHVDPRLAHRQWKVVSSVVSVSVGHPVPNLTEPVVLVLRTGASHRPVMAAYWDFSANDGLGDWRTDGCQIIERKGNHTLVHAYHLSYFTIIEDVSEKPAVVVMEPVMYVGSCVCMLCMLLVFITYTSCFKVIVCPKKMKHSVINLCLALLLLLLTFVLGIDRTDMLVPCQVTGICLHYFTLAAAFWITITANNMYKKLMKADRPPSPPPEPVSMPLPPKPILRFYFLGWGVPIIICGITAAVNLDHYQGIQYCFLAWEPSLGAFYAPMGFLLFLNIIFFLRIACVAHAQAAAALADSVEAEEVHTNEIELVPNQADTKLEVQSVVHDMNKSNRRSRNISVNGGGVRRSALGGSSRLGSDDEHEEDAESTISLPDAEREPVTQLRALVATLFLYIIMWACGALAVARPFSAFLPYQGLIFSYLYGFFSALFGIFMLTYFCLTRTDTRSGWKGCLGIGPADVVAVPVCEEQPEDTADPSTLSTQPNGAVVKSSSNLDVSVLSQKQSNLPKACNLENDVSKPTNNSNVNLVSLLTPSLTEVSAASGQEVYPNFYNPRQNGAARKFWQKTRQHKVLNKDVNKDVNAVDSTSGTEHSQQLSQGAGSDTNNRLSVEIQVEDQNKETDRNLIGGVRNDSLSLDANPNTSMPSQGQPPPPYSCRVNTTTAALITAPAERTPSPLAQKSDSGSRGPGSHSPSPASPAGSQQVVRVQQTPQQAYLQHERTPSCGSQGAPHSAFSPVQPRSCAGILSSLSKPDSAPPPINMLSTGLQSEGGCAAKNTFTDGQKGTLGQGSAGRAGVGTPSFAGYDSYVHPSYLPPQLCNIAASPAYPHFSSPQALARSISPLVSSMQGVMHLPHPYSPSLSPAQTHQTQPLSGDSSDTSTRQRCYSHSSSHSNGIQCSSAGANTHETGNGQRGNGSKSPVESDITTAISSCDGQATAEVSDSQCQTKKARSIDSDHHSDPTHRKKHRSRDKYGHRRGQGGITKQRSLGWEEHFKGRPAKLSYAYVNHNYRDKVMTKLIKQASESDDLAKKAFWLPRSLSEYDRLTQVGVCSRVEDSTSSSVGEDSFDSVWFPLKHNSDSFKKETSV